MRRTALELDEAGNDDAACVAALIEAMGYPCDPAEARRRIEAVRADPSQQLVLARCDGHSAGLLGLQLVYSLALGRHCCRITALVVDPRFRRRGIARQLLREAEARARLAGAARIEVAAGPQRSDGHALYRACGYGEGSLRFVKPLVDA